MKNVLAVLSEHAGILQIARKRIMTLVAYHRRYRYDAAVKMKQGMGRPIRSETDHGRVVILDTRWRQEENAMLKS